MIIIQPEWIFGLVGGVMIGCAAALFLLANGAIMGASGLLGGLIDGSGRHNWHERAAFLVGLIGMPAIFVLVSATDWTTNVLDDPTLLILAGVLVGLGTRLANGCTSGHGVCGMSRLSIRGTIATLLYVGAGAVAVFVLRHMVGLN